MYFFRRHWKSIVTISYWIGCFIGFIIQSNEICRVYFAYKTTTWIEMSIPDELPIPSLSVCIRYFDNLNRTNNEDYGLANNATFLNESSPLTLKQIFKLTPSSIDTLKDCNLRIQDMFEAKPFNQSECLDKFNITKYYTQEFICYMYFIKSNMSISFKDVSHSLYWPNAIFQINLKNVNSSQWLYVIVDPKSTLPLYSRNFGKSFGREASDPLSFNYFTVTFRHNEIIRLEPPFETMCTNDKNEEESECIRRCLIEKLRGIDRFPSSEMTSVPVDMKHVNGYDYKNSTMQKNIDFINKDCKNSCKRPLCNLSYATTEVAFSNMNEHDILRFKLMIPNSASAIITFNPKTHLLDFVIYLCSCLSLWFGISVASINPIQSKKLFLRTRTPKMAPQSMTFRHEMLLNRYKGRIEELRQEVAHQRAIINVLVQKQFRH